MSPIKKWAMMEPLVDIAEKKAMNSECCPIFVNQLFYLKKIFIINFN